MEEDAEPDDAHDSHRTKEPPERTIIPEDPEAPAPAATNAAVSLPKSYAAPSKRAWQKVVKSPDTYVGKGYKLWACIYQFDAATGEDGFMAYASYKKLKYWFSDGENAAFVGSAPALADYVEGDVVTMSVVTLGSYSYDTQAGGNTTVPSFQVVKIKRQKGSCD
jgi:hypothetical protein